MTACYSTPWGLALRSTPKTAQRLHKSTSPTVPASESHFTLFLPHYFYLSFCIFFFQLPPLSPFIFSPVSLVRSGRGPGKNQRLRSPVVKINSYRCKRKTPREREVSADRWGWLLLQTPLLPILSRCASCQSLLRLCVRVLYHKNLISFRLLKGIFLAHKTFISNLYRVTGSLWHSSLPLPN